MLSINLLNTLRRSSFLVVLIAMFFTGTAQQDIKEFTLRNIHEIKNIDPDSVNFDDLAEIGKAIGNARIVMLGEQTHGDAASFLAKTRIVKYLHEKMGFDVLVFESDFWGLNQIWDNIPSTGFSIDAIRNNTYAMWAVCQQMQPLYSYINKCYQSKMPLIVSGMDCRHSSYYRTNYINRFDSLVLQKSAFNLKIADAEHFKTILAELMKKEYNSKVCKADRRFFVSMIDTLKATARCNSFWRQELNNLKGCALNAWNLSFLNQNTNKYRDMQMADNLYWLYHEKYAGKKIIVWAANCHIARNMNTAFPKIFFYNQTTGNEIYKILKDTVYTLACTSYTGRYGGTMYFKKYPIHPPHGECLEKWMHSKAVNYGFIDFKKYTGSSRFKMVSAWYWEIKARWASIYDGVFYIKQMYPSDDIK